MRKRTLFFVLFLLSLSRAQQSSTKAPWDSLEFFVGNWQGTFQGEPGHGTGEQHYQFVLQDKFLQATNKSVYLFFLMIPRPPISTLFPYTTLLVVPRTKVL